MKSKIILLLKCNFNKIVIFAEFYDKYSPISVYIVFYFAILDLNHIFIYILHKNYYMEHWKVWEDKNLFYFNISVHCGSLYYSPS